MNSDTNGGAVRQVRSREFYEDRARAMFCLRTVEGLTLNATGARFSVSRSRARQIINIYISKTIGRRPDPAQMSRDAAAIRRNRRESDLIEPDRRGGRGSADGAIDISDDDVSGSGCALRLGSLGVLGV